MIKSTYGRTYKVNLEKPVSNSTKITGPIALAMGYFWEAASFSDGLDLKICTGPWTSVPTMDTRMNKKPRVKLEIHRLHARSATRHPLHQAT